MMTREQVEKMCCRFLVDVREEFRADVQAIAAHDADLRQRIKELEEQRDAGMSLNKTVKP